MLRKQSLRTGLTATGPRRGGIRRIWVGLAGPPF
jgi:hypothetical protein